MELEHSFIVPVPKERAWDVLLDVERVAPCMPGASLDSVDGDEIHGRIKVKVGPISMTYAGTAKIVERDEKAGIVRLDASGKETRGAGTASASVRSVLEDRGHETQVTVLTTLNVTGKPAQFGRGVMVEVGGKLLTIFANNLAAMLASSEDVSADAAQAPADAPAAAGVGDTSLDGLKLPPRAVASLSRDGITTVHELAGKTEHDLLAIDGIGPASVEDIKATLAEHGLVLGQPADSAAATTASTGSAGAGPEPGPGSAGAGSAGSAGAAPVGAAGSGPAGGAGAGPAGSAGAGPAGAGPAGAAGSGSTGAGSTGAGPAGAAGSGSTGAGAAGAAAANGAAPSVKSGTGTSGNGSRTGATSAPPSRAAGQSAAHIEADSLNLIKVAGMPVLKRSLPVIAGVSVVVYFGVRRKMRRRNK